MARPSKQPKHVMARGATSSAVIGWLTAGALLIFGGHESFAQNSSIAYLPTWAVFPAQLPWPSDPRFSTQGLWPNDPRYKTSLSPIAGEQPFLSPFEQDRLFAFKSSGSSNSGALNFAVDSDFRDSTKTEGKSFLGFFVGSTSKWQENQVGYTNLKK